MNSLEKDRKFLAFICLQLLFWFLTVLSGREWQFCFLVLLIPTNVLALLTWKRAVAGKALNKAGVWLVIGSPLLAFILAAVIAYFFF
jgi:hypothetical protein